MLTGTSPFSASAVNEVLELNKKNKIRFDEYPWVSKEAQKFILKLTNTDPHLRPDATEALRDKWLIKNESLVKAKDLMKDSMSVNKLNSYSFYKDLAKEIPNEFTDSNEFNTFKFRRKSYGMMLKIGKVPSFEIKHKKLSCERKNQKLAKGTLDSFPPYKFVDNSHLEKDPSIDHTFNKNSSSLNRISDCTLSGISKIKTKSNFASQAQSNPINAFVN